MKCEHHNCDSLYAGKVTLTGEIDIDLCSKHARIWQTNEEVNNILHEIAYLKVSAKALDYSLKIGGISSVEFKNKGNELSDQFHEKYKQIRALAKEIYPWL